MRFGLRKTFPKCGFSTNVVNMNDKPPGYSTRVLTVDLAFSLMRPARHFEFEIPDLEADLVIDYNELTLKWSLRADGL
jgi:hypothetical protein